MNLEEAREIANEFLSTIFGPADQRQSAKADEMAELLIGAFHRGQGAGRAKVVTAKLRAIPANGRRKVKALVKAVKKK